MILNSLKLINRDQRGMTLIEMILVMSIVAIIGAAGTTTYFQVMRGSGTSNNRAVAISNIERAADWFTIDALQAQGNPNPDQPIPDIFDPENPVFLGPPITLEWIDDTQKDEDGNIITRCITVIYDKENDRLIRIATITDNTTGKIITSEIGQVAQYISYINCDYDWIKDIFYLTIESTVGTNPLHKVIETRSYEIISRTDVK